MLTERPAKRKIRFEPTDGIEEFDYLLELQKDFMPQDTPYDTNKGAWWVGYDGEVPVAFCGITHSSVDGWGYLARAAVAKTHRGMGIQKRMIRLRVRHARRQGWKAVITDTSNANHPSSNSLMSCGFKLYEPGYRWAFANGLYWRLKLEKFDD